LLGDIGRLAIRLPQRHSFDWRVSIMSRWQRKDGRWSGRTREREQFPSVVMRWTLPNNHWTCISLPQFADRSVDTEYKYMFEYFGKSFIQIDLVSLLCGLSVIVGNLSYYCYCRVSFIDYCRAPLPHSHAQLTSNIQPTNLSDFLSKLLIV